MKSPRNSPPEEQSSILKPETDTTTSKPKKTPTIKEFAEIIGVSPTTISRSISRHGRISDETREMVLQRMKELGYTPNLNARRLVLGRAHTMALCIGGGLAPTNDLFMVRLIRGLQQALQRYDYGLLIVGPGDSLKRSVDSRAVDGVIVVGGNEGDTDAEMARSIVRPEVPCVLIGTEPLEPAPHVGSVYIDLAAGCTKVANALFDNGHRSIGYIGSSYSHVVLPAFKRELAHLGVPMRDEWAIIAGDTPADGERAMNELLALPEPPTAIFTRTDELAMGAIRAARKQHIEIPGQLSIFGHDDLAFAQYIEPPLSTVRIDCDAVGQAAVTMLFDLLNNPDSVFEARPVSTELLMRETVGPPTKN